MNTLHCATLHSLRSRRWRLGAAVVVLLSVSAWGSPALVHAQKMYWTDAGTNKIQWADLDGQNVQDLVTGLSEPQGIALDVAGGGDVLDRPCDRQDPASES